MRIEDYRGIINLYSGILTGLGALVWYRMTNLPSNFFDIAVTDKELDGIKLFGAEYVYVPDLDVENFLIPCEYNQTILIPTRERALVDYMRFGIAVEEDENLMIALQEYDILFNGDFSKVLAVAEFYGVRCQMEKEIELSKDWDSEN
jgi:hypothetical protein